MTNTQRYLNSIKGFRKALREVNGRYKPEYARLEHFKDSASYAQSKKLVVLAAEEGTADALRVRCWEDNSFCIRSKVLLDGIRTVAPQVGAQDSCLLHGRLLKEQNAAAFDMNAIETITEAE